MSEFVTHASRVVPASKVNGHSGNPGERPVLAQSGHAGRANSIAQLNIP
jgi:hypothetical protein